MMKKTILFVTLVIMAAVLAAQALTAGQTGVRSINLPPERVNLKPGDGLDQVQMYCAVCHSLDYIPMQPKGSKAQWSAGVNKMIKVFGATIPEDKVPVIADYLAAQYGTGK